MALLEIKELHVHADFTDIKDFIINVEKFTEMAKNLDKDIEDIKIDIEQIRNELQKLTKPTVIWTIRKSGLVIKTNGDKIMAELREGQEVDLEVSLQTRAGNPATYEEGTAQWSVLGENVGAVELIEDPDNELRVTVRGIDGSNNDSVVVEFRADGDPDEDESRDIIATADLTVTQGEAFVANMTVSPARDSVFEDEDEDEDETDEDGEDGETDNF